MCLIILMWQKSGLQRPNAGAFDLVGDDHDVTFTDFSHALRSCDSTFHISLRLNYDNVLRRRFD